MATWNFNENPVIVDFEGALTTEDREKIQTVFDALRSSNLPNCAIYIATRYDRESKMWTKDTPSKMVQCELILI